jgi:hypothetical protein
VKWWRLWPIFIPVIILALLLARPVFSDRTLIANFEPFPDTFHYIIPPRCFLDGQGWQLCRAGLPGIKPVVPPLYSVVLLPALAISSDPRIFYLVNVILATLTTVLLGKLLWKTSGSSSWTFLSLLFFVTTYSVYWYPSVAMAENVVLPLWLLSVWLLLQPPKLSRTILGIAAALGLFLAKYVYLPLAVVMIVSFLVKTLTSNIVASNVKKLLLLTSIAGGVLGYLVLRSELEWIVVINIWAGLQGRPAPITWFSLDHWIPNFKTYWGMLHGYKIFTLWDETPVVTPLVAAIGWIGLGASIVTEKRWWGVSLLAMLLVPIALISFFYAADGRYLIQALPTLLLGGGLFVRVVPQKMKHELGARLLLLFLGTAVLLQTLLRAPQLKLQLALNLKYSEQPWFYLAAKEIDQAILLTKASHPIVVSALPPYLLDFYLTQPATIYPLSKNQDFTKDAMTVWGVPSAENMPAVIQAALNENRVVLVNSWRQVNDPQNEATWQKLNQTFELQLIRPGCHEACNTYRVTTKQ